MTTPSQQDPLENELSRQVWRSKYQYRPPERAPAEGTIRDTWTRVAAALASVEQPQQRARWQESFRAALEGFQFLPAGRILAGAGTQHQSTLFNCFVMDVIDDSLEGIFESLKQSALTMQWGGGIGCDFSTLRPRGAEAQTRGTTASGPVSFMKVWDAMCATLLSTGARRGAMMATLRCDHPDIEAFIDAKRHAGTLANFNLSVQITEEFMAAVAEDRDWALVFPEDPELGGEIKRVRWPGLDGETACRIWGRVPARRLWNQIMSAAYDTAEPGVLFIDRINRWNNLYYREQITATNPCGEVPLPPHGACDLGSINLTTFVRDAFTRRARLDLEAISHTARLATRLLDNVIDLSKYPLTAQSHEARSSRRIGLGITGLGDALIMLGLAYDSDEARDLARDTLRQIRDCAYRTSVALAEEKGAFPYFERDPYLAGPYPSALPADIRDAISRTGIRNSHLIAIAPTGTISLLANDVSSGIEPVFAFEGRRRVLNPDGVFETYDTVDRAMALWRRTGGDTVPRSFVTAHELSPEAHLAMQAVLQPLVDHSISKTINVPADVSVVAFKSIYARAHELGLKGCTVFRPNAVTGSILLDAGLADRAHCCPLEREGD